MPPPRLPAPPPQRKSGAGVIVLVIVLLAVLGAGGYVGYTKWRAAQQAAAQRAAQTAAAQTTSQPTLVPATEQSKLPEPEHVTPATPQKQPSVPANTESTQLPPPPVTQTPPSTAVQTIPETPHRPIAVANPNVLHKVTAVYPEFARRTRLSGMVKLQVIIATDGSVRQVTVLSGNAVLSPAAVNAVKQWRYEPVLLSGQPVEASTVVQFDFKMD